MRSPLFQPFPMLAGRRAQVWRYRPAYRRPRHFHDEPELNVVVRGWCVMGVGNAAVHLAAGQLVSFAPGQDHVGSSFAARRTARPCSWTKLARRSRITASSPGSYGRTY